MPPKVPSKEQFAKIAQEAVEARAQQREAETSRRIHKELHELAMAAFKDAPTELSSEKGRELIKVTQPRPRRHCITRLTGWSFQEPSEHEGEKYIVGFRCKQEKEGWTDDIRSYVNGGRIAVQDWQEQPVILEMVLQHPATATENTFSVAEIGLDKLGIFNEEGSGGGWYVPIVFEGVQEEVSTIRDTLALLS